MTLSRIKLKNICYGSMGVLVCLIEIVPTFLIS